MTLFERKANRRHFVAGAASTVLLSAVPGVKALAAVPSTKSFPDGFHWGVSTAAYQVEGNNINSDFWVLERVKPTTFVEPSGDACDSYHRYEEDIALLASLGFDTYRLSIEWGRIEPDQGVFSNAELDYYKRVLDCCHRYKVKPAVTFLHGTTPIWFAKLGGWLNPDGPKLFAEYCSVAAKHLAGSMSFAFTINEPQVAKSFRALPGVGAGFAGRDKAAYAMHEAAAKALGSERFVTLDWPDIDAMTPQLIAGHEQGFKAIKAERSGLLTGVTLNVIDFQALGEGSPYMEIRKKAYGEWIDTVIRAGDFTGIQTYRTFPIPGPGQKMPSMPPPSAGVGEGMMNEKAHPEALADTVEYIYEQTKKPTFVTENGLQTKDDAHRVEYIDATLAGLHRVITKGVPVMGYLHWSLLDNFEWARGYEPNYGLVAVDRKTFKRTPKPSAAHLGAIARRNAL